VLRRDRGSAGTAAAGGRGTTAAGGRGRGGRRCARGGGKNVAAGLPLFLGPENMQLWPGKRRGVLSFVSPFSQKDTPITAVGGWGGMGGGGGPACTRRAQVSSSPHSLSLSLHSLAGWGAGAKAAQACVPTPKALVPVGAPSYRYPDAAPVIPLGGLRARSVVLSLSLPPSLSLCGSSKSVWNPHAGMHQAAPAWPTCVPPMCVCVCVCVVRRSPCGESGACVRPPSPPPPPHPTLVGAKLAAPLVLPLPSSARPPFFLPPSSLSSSLGSTPGTGTGGGAAAAPGTRRTT
jgi:hypothetical protein